MAKTELDDGPLGSKAVSFPPDFLIMPPPKPVQYHIKSAASQVPEAIKLIASVSLLPLALCLVIPPGLNTCIRPLKTLILFTLFLPGVGLMVATPFLYRNKLLSL